MNDEIAIVEDFTVKYKLIEKMVRLVSEQDVTLSFPDTIRVIKDSISVAEINLLRSNFALGIQEIWNVVQHQRTLPAAENYISKHHPFDWEVETIHCCADGTVVHAIDLTQLTNTELLYAAVRLRGIVTLIDVETLVKNF